MPCPKARRRREGPGAAPSREGPLSGHGPFFRASPRAQSLPAGPQPPAPPALLPLPIINPNKCPLTRAGPLVPCPKARRHRRSRAGPSSCHGPFPRRSSRPLRARPCQPTTWGIIKVAPRTSPGWATLTCTSTAPRSALRRMARAATPRTEGGPRRPLGSGARQAPCRALGAAGQQPGPQGLHRQGRQGTDQWPARFLGRGHTRQASRASPFRCRAGRRRGGAVGCSSGRRLCPLGRPCGPGERRGARLHAAPQVAQEPSRPRPWARRLDRQPAR